MPLPHILIFLEGLKTLAVTATKVCGLIYSQIYRQKRFA